MIVRLTPQQRIRLAQNLRKQLQLPSLSEQQRQSKRRHIWNLMKLNELEAIRRKGGDISGCGFDVIGKRTGLEPHAPTGPQPA